MRPPPRAILALAGVLLLGTAPGARLAASERCGPYTLVNVNGVVPKGRGELTLIDRAGRRVHEIHDVAVHIEGCTDVTGDGRPELVVSTYSGGQRCCTTFHVLALGPPVRTILRWEAGSQWHLELTDLADATRSKELAGRDDRLSAFGGLPVAFSPTLPVIFCYERTTFVDCTRRIYEPALEELTEVRDGLKAETDATRRRAGGLSVLALSIVVDEEAATWTWLSELAPDVVPWLKERHAVLAACLKTSALTPRDERLARCAAREEPR